MGCHYEITNKKGEIVCPVCGLAIPMGYVSPGYTDVPAEDLLAPPHFTFLHFTNTASFNGMADGELCETTGRVIPTALDRDQQVSLGEGVAAVVHDLQARRLSLLRLAGTIPHSKIVRREAEHRGTE